MLLWSPVLPCTVPCPPGPGTTRLSLMCATCALLLSLGLFLSVFFRSLLCLLMAAFGVVCLQNETCPCHHNGGRTRCSFQGTWYWQGLCPCSVGGFHRTRAMAGVNGKDGLWKHKDMGAGVNKLGNQCWCPHWFLLVAFGYAGGWSGNGTCQFI